MVNQAKKSVLEVLNSTQIPVLSPGTPDLLNSLSDDAINFYDMAKIIEQFPGIAARLIAIANSAWSSPVSEITSLEMACNRLGLNVVRNLSIALSVASPFDATRCAEFDTEYYWSNAMLVAEVASMLEPVIDVNQELETSTARTAGLLHNLGLLLLVDQFPTEMNEAFKQVKQEKADDLHQALFQVIGCDDGEVGRVLGENWYLPQSIVCAMSFYNDLEYEGEYKQLVIIVGLAAYLVSSFNHGYPLDSIEKQCKKLNIAMTDIEKIQQSLEQQSIKIKEIAAALFSS